MHGARPAQSHPASELRPGHPQGIAQDPQQRGRGVDIHLHRLPIHMKTCHLWSPSVLDENCVARLDEIIDPKVMAVFPKIRWLQAKAARAAKIRGFPHPLNTE